MELPSHWWSVLEEIVAGELAWVRLPLDDAIAELELVGLVEVWDLPTGPAVTLSPLCAERLGLVLVESGPAELPRWQPDDEPSPPIVQPRDPDLCGSTPTPDLFALTRVDAQPATRRDIREWAARRQRRRQPRKARRCTTTPPPR